jgi:predicted nucleic acid-binding protein
LSGGVRYLLDTNVVSETRKTRPDKRVTGLLAAADASGLFLSVLTVGELRRGVAAKRRSDPDAAAHIAAWVDDLETNFADRILPIDTAIAKVWGELSAHRSRPVVDTLIAATALVHDLTLVTRNTEDVRGIAMSVIDPWTDGSAPT